jgi:hypothetical protein
MEYGRTLWKVMEPPRMWWNVTELSGTFPYKEMEGLHNYIEIHGNSWNFLECSMIFQG